MICLLYGGAYENTSYTVCIFTQTAHNSQTIFKIIIFHISVCVNSLDCFHICAKIFLVQCTHCQNLFCTFCPSEKSK